MSPTSKKVLKNTLRWGIAIFGIWYVLSRMSLRDQVRVFSPTAAAPPAWATLDETDAKEDQLTYRVAGRGAVPRADTANQPDRKQITLSTPTGPKTVPLWGLDLEGELHQKPTVARVLVQDPVTLKPVWHPTSDVVGGYVVRVPYPRVDVGISRMVRNARAQWLWLAVLIFPITMLMCAYRWHELLKALDIHLGVGRTFVLTMVGAFYNTFMPGSTGGDVLKAYYVSKVTPHRTRAVMSVLIDRIIGLIALIILGGTMAATQWGNAECRKIAIASGLIISGTALGLVIFYNRTLHRLSGLDFIIKRLPKQKQVQNAVQVMEIYRARPLLVLWALVVTFPVHMTVVASAMLAGRAFGLPLPWHYYWAIVPVIVLVGALPISPQGAGVMEYFAIKLTETRGATVSQAFALTMSIRVVQIVWNLTGGFFVLKGGFHAPTADEKKVVADPESPAAGPLPEPG